MKYIFHKLVLLLIACYVQYDIYCPALLKGTPGLMVAMPGLSPGAQLTLGASGLGAQAQLCGTQPLFCL